MDIALQAMGLKKTFTLSAKQRQMEKTTEKKKVAVNGSIPPPAISMQKRNGTAWAPFPEY